MHTPSVQTSSRMVAILHKEGEAFRQGGLENGEKNEVKRYREWHDVTKGVKCGDIEMQHKQAIPTVNWAARHACVFTQSTQQCQKMSFIILYFQWNRRDIAVRIGDECTHTHTNTHVQRQSQRTGHTRNDTDIP